MLKSLFRLRDEGSRADQAVRPTVDAISGENNGPSPRQPAHLITSRQEIGRRVVAAQPRGMPQKAVDLIGQNELLEIYALLAQRIRQRDGPR